MPIIVFAEPYEPGATRGTTQISCRWVDHPRGTLASYEDRRAEAPGYAAREEEYPASHFYWTKETHVGHVLSEYERNGYDDSDFYATYWDAEKGEPVTVQFATTRGWTYPLLATRVDATPEVRAAYDAWRAVKLEEQRVAAAAKEAATPRIGKTVEVTVPVTRGKSKCAAGERGEVFWLGKDGFARGDRYSSPMQRSIMNAIDPLRDFRVGLKLADGRKVFLPIGSVKVVAG